MRYRDHKLGSCVQEVIKRFYAHPGQGDKKPFGFDVHQGFEFFLHADNRLYRKQPGVMIPLTSQEEREMLENIGMGAVEMYLRRPRAELLTPCAPAEKILLHAATGESMPWSIPEAEQVA
ncbi:hypothetical protein D3C78_1515390 [compost metagenome]